MIRTPRLFNPKSYLKSEYTKLETYIVDLEENIKKTTKAYKKVLSITVPIEDMNIIVQLHGIDETGMIKYDMFGKADSKYFSKDHVKVVELSFYGEDEIIHIKELYKTLDGYGKSFNCDNHLKDVDTVHRICNAVLSRYFCTRYSELEKDLPHLLDYYDYLMYLEF